MGVDKILIFATDSLVGALFSEILTKRHLQLNFVTCHRHRSLLRFPQIHSAHHNNKLYSFLILEKSCGADCCCGLLLLDFNGKCRRRSCVSHLFPQCGGTRRTLYFAKKRVQYRSGRIEATEGVSAALVEGNFTMNGPGTAREGRSEEHTSELQSLTNLVCRLLLVKNTHNTS